DVTGLCVAAPDLLGAAHREGVGADLLNGWRAGGVVVVDGVRGRDPAQTVGPGGAGVGGPAGDDQVVAIRVVEEVEQDVAGASVLRAVARGFLARGEIEGLRGGRARVRRRHPGGESQGVEPGRGNADVAARGAVVVVAIDQAVLVVVDAVETVMPGEATSGSGGGADAVLAGGVLV